MALGAALVLWGLQDALRTPLPWPIVAVTAASFLGVVGLYVAAARGLERSWGGAHAAQ